MKLSEAAGNFNAQWTLPDSAGNIRVPDIVTTLKGCPNYVAGNFMCGKGITSLLGCPQYVMKDFNILNTNIRSLRELKGMPNLKVGTIFFFNSDKIKDPLNFFFVSGINWVSSGASSPSPGLGFLLSKYLRQKERDMIACQQAMIDAGFGEYARL